MDNDNIVYLPTFHWNFSNAKKFDNLIEYYPNNHIKQSIVYTVAKRTTHTQQKNLRALHYNITDLLCKLQHRLKVIVCDLYEEFHKQGSKQVQSYVDEIYMLVQKIPPHNLSFTIGNAISAHDACIRLIIELIWCFFRSIY